MTQVGDCDLCHNKSGAVPVAAIQGLLQVMAGIADYAMSDEADLQESEELLGLDYEEIIKVAHDSMIAEARDAMSNWNRMVGNNEPKS